MTWAAIRWKLRQKYSQLRSLVGGGRFIWQVEPNIRFVARSDDRFSHVLFVCKGHEMTELRWCRRWLRPGDSVIDCGANVGYFSAYLAQSISLEQILAIEGNPRTAAICADNFDVLEIKNARVVRIILAANEAERLVIPDVPGREPWQRTVHAGKADPSVPVSTLDRLIETYRIRASLVKIDCEGYEPFILAGSRELLRSQSAAFMVECNDAALLAAQTSRTELFGLFRQHDYALFHLASFGSYYPFGIRCDESFPPAEFNFAAIPNNPSDLKKWQAIASDFQSPSGMDNNRSSR
jgi:FkbM family methyltransferase